MGPGIGDQGIKAMLRCFGLCFDLQGIVACVTDIAEEEDRGEWPVGERRRQSTRQTANGVRRRPDTGCWALHIEVVPCNQDVVTARTGIPHGEYDIARQCLFDVQVVLTHPAQLEVGGLRIKGAGKCSNGRWRWNGLWRRASVQARWHSTSSQRRSR